MAVGHFAYLDSASCICMKENLTSGLISEPSPEPTTDAGMLAGSIVSNRE